MTKAENHLDCVVIGYNEVPFVKYESFLRNYGEDAEAYRDLKFSFVNLDGRKLVVVAHLAGRVPEAGEIARDQVFHEGRPRE